MDSPLEDSKKGRILSGITTRSQMVDARAEKTLNFLRRKSIVPEKNYVKNYKKRKRLRNSSNVGVVYPKRRKVYDVEKEKSSSEELEIGDFYVRPEKHYKSRISAHTNVDVVNLLYEKLDTKQIQMFRETCFGCFLDLPHVVVQNQLIHHLLLREVVQEEEDVLWISVKDVKLRFGLVEFGIITGLNCTGDADKCFDSDRTDRLVNTYFSELTRIPKQSLIDCFLDKRWKSDEDAVKIAVLYFIHTFLFSTMNRKYISRDEFDLVETGAYEKYPWGKAVFKATLESMKGKLWGKPSMYRLGGLPLAFQCWFYECCPYVNDKIAFLVDDKVPRILNWKVTKQPCFRELSDGIFKKRRDDQLKLRNISPTIFEQTTLGLPESFGNDRVNEMASGDDTEVHLGDDDFSNPHPPSRKQPKTKLDTPLNNVDWIPEFKRLSDRLSDLKSEIQMEFASLKDSMRVSFENVFKAIESLSKKQGEKTAFVLNGGNDPHGDNDSFEFSNSEDNGSEGQEHVMDSMGDKENNEKANEGATGDVEGGETLGVSIVVYESQILPDTHEVPDHISRGKLTKPIHPAPVLESPHVNQGDTGVEGSSKKSSNVVDNVDNSLLTEFDKWVDEGMKKQSK